VTAGAGVPRAERDRRYARLRAAMAEQELDALLAFAPGWRRENVRYLTGAPLLSAAAFAYLPADGDPAAFVARPGDAAAIAAAGAVDDVRSLALPQLGELVARLREDVGRGRVGVAHAEFVPHAIWHTLTRALPELELEGATELMDRVRLVKSEWEIEQIRQAAAICDLGWRAFLEAMRPGVAEYELVADVEAVLKEAGAEDNFMIIASGRDEVRGMTPPSERRLEVGDMVRTELTPQWQGYWAQICRSAILGTASSGQRDSWSIFEEAVASGLSTVRPGATAHDVAKAENDVFRRHGLGEYCSSQHTRVRGHGHGLHLDEFPVVEGADTVLEPNVVLIVHPNTYTPLAGYHVLGDPVIVSDGGYEPLLRSSRALAEVPA
jgi:Xaa-Pro aminopeptidase